MMNIMLPTIMQELRGVCPNHCLHCSLGNQW